MDDGSPDFVTAFNQIEQWLNKQCRTTKYETFSTLLEKCQGHPIVGRYTFELRTFGQLRNMLAHDRRAGHPIATVHAQTVVEIKTILNLLLSPPSLGSVAKRRVYTCKPHDPIRPVLAIMHHEDYSQVPVYTEAGLAGLLNTEAVSRWLAAELNRGEGIYGDETVADAMEHRSKVKTFHVLGEGQTVVDAFKLFEDGYEKGRSVDAVIVTKHGKRLESATGIITEFDLPGLRDYLVL